MLSIATNTKKRSNARHWGPSGYKFRVWDYLVPEGTVIEDLLDHSYWLDQSREAKYGDEIRCVFEDGSGRVVLDVIEQRENVGLKVCLIANYSYASKESSPEMPSPHDDYAVEWGGPVHKWRVVRIKDRAVVEKGFTLREEAQTALKSHQRVMAA